MEEPEARTETAEEYVLRIPMWTKEKHTQKQLRELLLLLGDPEADLRIIHVAGTNGKGSVCADLTSILMEAGYHVGTFVSPHLVQVRERFLLDGIPVEPEDFEWACGQVREAVFAAMERGWSHPSFFEYVFLMAMVLFARKRPDYVVLETGLGGRRDATNAVRSPLACIITSISLDHTQYLGHTAAQIAGEKAGIIKPGIPVIYDDNLPEASEVIRSRAKACHAPAYPVGEKQQVKQVRFQAPYQAMNAALAVKALQVLSIQRVDGPACRRGLEKVRWPGRMEAVGPDIWLDGAHNPGGIQAFIQAVKAQKSQKPVHLLFAAVSDKDYRQMVEMLCRELSPSHVTVAHMESQRGMEEGRLAALFSQAGCQSVEQYGTTREALKAALNRKGEEDRLFAVGSLYLIGEIKEQIGGMKDAGF